MSSVLNVLQQGLVVSCQPLPGSPMDRPDIIVAMAGAAVAAGACGLRIEGVDNVRAVLAAWPQTPVIGIVKRDLVDSPVRITPYVQDAQDLLNAGAHIVAFDGTLRTRPATVAALLQVVKRFGGLAMADCATLEDGLLCHGMGCDLVGTTLSGYTADTAHISPDEPDLALITQLAQHGVRVVAEGRIRTPAQAAAALQAGAYTVTVGSAITRIEHITEWFISAMQASHARTDGA